MIRATSMPANRSAAAALEFLFQMPSQHLPPDADARTPRSGRGDGRRPDGGVLAAFELGTFERARGAACALGLGDGRAEVIDALLVTRSHTFAARLAASMLAERHPHVLRRLMEVLANPSDPRLSGVLRPPAGVMAGSTMNSRICCSSVSAMSIRVLQQTPPT